MSLKPDKRQPLDCHRCEGEGIVAHDGKVYECPVCEGFGWVVVDDEAGK